MSERMAMYMELSRLLKQAREKQGMTTLETALELDIDHTRPDVAIGARERNGVKTLHLIIEHCLAIGADPHKIIGAAIDKYLQRKQQTKTRKTG